MSQLVTIRQFAEELQASEFTVRNWIRDTIIPVYHIRHFIRIDREAALEALRSYKRKPRKGLWAAKKRSVMTDRDVAANALETGSIQENVPA